MTGIITILQNKRVALPYIFGKYAFPVMQKLFPGKLILYHIFHDVNFKNAKLASNQQLGQKHLQHVRQFVKEYKFTNALIYQHTKTSTEAPALPSIKLALQVASDENADIHLWMEDDAIVFDPNCNTWFTTLANGDVGLYRDTNQKEMINLAYFLSTREFDNRFALMLEEYKKHMSLPSNKGEWETYRKHGSQIEHTAWRASRKPVLLNSNCAFRHHPYETYRRTRKDVEEWLQKIFPHITLEDIKLLETDFDE